MATHCSIPAHKIPWTEEPGRLQSIGHKESDTSERARVRAHTHTHTHTFTKQPHNNLFICSIDRHWGCFQDFAATNNTAENILVFK